MLKFLVLFALVAFTCTAGTPQLFTSTTGEIGSLSYCANVGQIGVSNAKGEEVADISYVAYTKQGVADAALRPITFVFNGGPGSSSIWLHMGAFGPKRILSPEEGQSRTPPYKLIDNGDSLLDLTDLVFIDPPGTGFSKVKSKDHEQFCYSTKGDVVCMGDFIEQFLSHTNRWSSPKYLAGESYGATRAAALTDYLHERGLYLTGTILISSALDYQTLYFDKGNVLPYILSLPTYTATAYYHKKIATSAPLEETIGQARHFAYTTYAPWLLQGGTKDSEQIYQELSKYTGLPEATIAKLNGRITHHAFMQELFADQSKVIGQYDCREIGDCVEQGKMEFNEDPSVTSIKGIFRGGFLAYLQNQLRYETLNHYEMLSLDVISKWNFINKEMGYLNVTDHLQRSLVVNPALKLFVGCGYYDLSTPFATSEYCFNQLPSNSAIQMEYYEGGHMYYLNPSAREKFKQDLAHFYSPTS